MRLTEDLLDRVVFRRGVQVSVTPGNLLGHVTSEFLDESLIDAGRGARADEAMTEEMPSPHFRPFGVGQCSLEVIVGLIRSQRLDGPSRPCDDGGLPTRQRTRATVAVLMPGSGTPLLAASNNRVLAEEMRSAWVTLQPFSQNFFESGRQRYAARRRPSSTRFFSWIVTIFWRRSTSAIFTRMISERLAPVWAAKRDHRIKEGLSVF